MLEMAGWANDWMNVESINKNKSELNKNKNKTLWGMCGALVELTSFV